MSPRSTIAVLCNSPNIKELGEHTLELDYRKKQLSHNVTIELPGFVRGLLHLDDRILDLLEIAAYVYSTDRYISRGSKDLVEYHSWSRNIDFHIRVRDVEFWSKPETMEALQRALLFMMGDSSLDFSFYGGHKTEPTSLFDRPGNTIDLGQFVPTVSLFSGGFDSLAGAVELLSDKNVATLLVSHQTQPRTIKTQRALVKALKDHYGGRIYHYQFTCHLRGTHGREESQRSRFFLYTSIALAVATATNQKKMYAYENGVTSINLIRRQDLINARASRTTHPQTIKLLEQLFSLILEGPFSIETPFIEQTKADVMTSLLNGPHPELISSTVSCSRAISHPGDSTHCGVCFQCIDRRLASFAVGAGDYDHNGLYHQNLIGEPIAEREARTTGIDMVRQALELADCGLDWFYEEYLGELAQIVDYLPIEGNELERVESVWNLCTRHGEVVVRALESMMKNWGDPRKLPPPNSLLSLVYRQAEHQKPPVIRLMESVIKHLGVVPEMYRVDRPPDENDLNIKISVLLGSHHDDLRSEHPTVSFACARVIPDHELSKSDLLIEAKYIRKSTTPAKANEGIASDLTKYPLESHILFFVYDPDHAIKSDSVYKGEIEARGRCTVFIAR